MNKYYKPMLEILVNTYHKDMYEVATDLNKQEDYVRCKEIIKDGQNFKNEYWLLSAGQLSEIYRGNNK